MASDVAVCVTGGSEAMTVANQRTDTEPARRRGLWASRAARGAAAVVAVGAAALSFRATSEVAETSGAVGQGYGWIVPLVVEAGVLTAAALAWVRSGEGLPARTETVVMAVLLALSVVVNVAHAAHGTLLGKVIAAAPPIVLLIAVEGLLREQRRTAAERTLTTAPPSAEPMRRPAPGEPQTQPPTGPALTPPSAGEPKPAILAQQRATAAGEVPLSVSDPERVAIQQNDSRQPTNESGVAGHAAAQSPARPAAEADSGQPPLHPADQGQGPHRPHPNLSVVNGIANADRELLTKIRAAVSAGEVVTGAMVAGWLGVSNRTGSRRLKALSDADPTLLLQRAAK